MKKVKLSRFSPGQELYLLANTCGLYAGTTLYAVDGRKLRHQRIEVQDRTGESYLIYSKYLAPVPDRYKQCIAFVVTTRVCGLPEGTVVFADPDFAIINQRINVKECDGTSRYIRMEHLERVE